MGRKVTLDRLEQQIEDTRSQYSPIRGEKRARIERILERARKTRNINIRVREQDLERLKKRAEEEGVPYQTLISSVLHKYVSERLVDEKDILKSIELLKSKASDKAMRESTFRRLVTADRAIFSGSCWGSSKATDTLCVIGGQAVNAYVEPLVSLDLDIAVAVEPHTLIEGLRGSFRVTEHPHSINLDQPGSDLRVQIQTDRRYADFVRQPNAGRYWAC